MSSDARPIANDATSWMISRIVETLAQMEVFSRPGPWALLDWPAHSNVGDSAIWQGTLALLEPRFQRPPCYVTRHDEEPVHLGRVCPEGPILLHGGGNFGDIWPEFQRRRLRLMRDFPDRKIVQLPQSLHFHNSEILEETRRSIARHRDFTLLVRDQASLDFARHWFECPVYLCPDMAYGIGRLRSEVRADAAVFSLMRTDHERHPDTPEGAIVEGIGPTDDWVQARWRRSDLEKISQSLSRKAWTAAWLMPKTEAVYRRQAALEVQRGADILARGQMVLTDRLHAHILCVLMNKPHLVFDNSYGKISGYIETWPDDGLTQRIASLHEAREMIEALGHGPSSYAQGQEEAVRSTGETD